MPQTESISVIIPVYNAEKYLKEAVESVLRQTVQPEEIFLIDDGSTDSSAEKAKEFLPDVTLISQKNKGISGARNAGIKRAKGQILAFLDSDDLWPEHHLDVLLTAFEQDENLAIVCGHVQQFLNEDTKELQSRIPEGQEVLPGYVAGASLIKKGVFDKVGLFDETLTLAEYVDWFSRAKDAGFQYKLIDDIVLKRRIHSTNIGIRHREKRHDYTKVLMASIKRKREKENKEQNN